MRTIKFDAIYKPTGEHIQPHELNFNSNIITYFVGREKEWCHFSLDGTYGDVILRQWTGLLDKNGKEIYEGDVCYLNVFGNLGESSEEESFYAQIVWENNGFHLVDFEGDTWTEWLTTYKGEDVEVIGNIYENPELLKEVVK